MASPKEHVEEIRKTKFSIGGTPNPLTEDLHQAVKNLSAELYAKDVHFLMEIIQNAEDNEYLEGVEPSLEFIITSRDITQTGAMSTLLIFNNEKGFSSKNIESICSVGRSTKKGNRKQGYIGEKGIGFKSVFLITARPYIFSKGYNIRFNEEPCPHCNVGYIVPEWVEENPILSDINQIYGPNKSLPATVIVLPLKNDKVKAVKTQLSNVHPEVLLFLSKIRRLSVKEDNEDPRLNTVNAISISSERNFVRRKNMDADSYTLSLFAEESSVASESECIYYMWKQKFPVKKENKVEKRMEVEEWVITLAFPYQQRVNRGLSSPGIYAFLPTEMVTNLPFIIQADFLLQSSREAILVDNKWNQGILDCVPSAFINAFTNLMKTEDAPLSTLPHFLRFLPVNKSPYPVLNALRESIRVKLGEEDIIPSESFTVQKFFHKPGQVSRLMPAFWNILNKARLQGVNLHSLSSHGRFILSGAFDMKEYDNVLNFMGVEYVDVQWYAKCIQSSNLVLWVSEDVYLELLVFLADNWRSSFQNSNIKSMPLLKYVDSDGSVSLCSINESAECGVGITLLSRDHRSISWLIDWNKEFGYVGNRHFVPKNTQEAIRSFSKKNILIEWLKNEVNIGEVTVRAYADHVRNSVGSNRKLVITYVHFLFHSQSNNYLSERETKDLCVNLPLLDNYGSVVTRRNGILVPAKGSKWVELILSNPWRQEGYVELGEEYLHAGLFAGSCCTVKNQLLEFLKTYIGACDIPNISPPNNVIPTVAAPLTKKNAFLLLDWVEKLMLWRVQIPTKFLNSIKEGSWMKISLSGSPGYKPPSQSFILTSFNGRLLQNGSVFVDIPLVDVEFYGHTIHNYKEVLKKIGVMFEYGEACEFMGKHLMSLASSSLLTKSNVFSILKFIKFLKEQLLSPQEFIKSIQGGKWLKTSFGYRSPVGCVLFDEEWRVASQISDICFLDKDYYGEEILFFKAELKLLGVIICFHNNYQLVADNLKYSSCLTSPTPEAVLLILQCMRHSESSDKLVKSLKDAKFLKTTNGYKSPGECFLFDSEWGNFLKIFKSLSIIDESFYRSSMVQYKEELKRTGVLVNFEEAAKAFARVFKQQASLSSVGTEQVLSFLAAYRQLRSTAHEFPSDLKNCIREAKWLRTRLGDHRMPKECILDGSDWEAISSIAFLPFIDDTDKFYGQGIHEYRKELKSMGVILEFQKGVAFIANGLCLPHDPSSITPASVLSLLECIKILQQRDPLPEAFRKKVSQQWIKTNADYRSPDKSLLYDSKWSSFLQCTDGPFVDEKFYGSEITSYRKELSAIGVITDVTEGSQVVANHIFSHSDFTTIVRIYNYLSEVKWEPVSKATRKIWIPDGGDNGQWVSPKLCVLHDKDGLFGSQFYILDKHYDKKLLHFFSSAFEVKSNPSIDDYCKLWKAWESSGCLLSNDKCCAFWVYVLKHWSSNTKKTLADTILKLPVYSSSDGILLSNKQDVFIADDLQLKQIFERASPHPIFVWYPQPSLPALPWAKLLEVYHTIGVRTISESVEKEESCKVEGFKLVQVNPTKLFIGKELVRLFLGVLADPSIKMEAQKRHEAAKCLLNVKVLETVEPVTVNYSLPLSSGETVNPSLSRLIRWDKENSTIIMQKMDRSGGHKNIIEYATHFSEVISQGLLWEKEELICRLSELIKLGFLVEFDEEAIGFLMMIKNLQIFAEDEEFLSTAFPSK